MPPQLLSCPSCQTLVHSDRLKELASLAQQAEQAGDLSGALANWRSVLALLPPGSQQIRMIEQQQVLRLSALVDEHGSTPPAKSAWRKGAAALGPVGAAIWKFKFVVWLVLSKIKLLLLGFTKIGTLLSMFASFGIYWTLWGWKFALGFVLCIYIHEMGHVIALRKFGIPATAPMFIPGFGAMVRLHQYPASAREDARVGLAGPIYGLGAALACLTMFAATGGGLWAALTRTGAWMNLFNLIPVWQLDGSRGLRALDKRQRLILLAIVGAMCVLTQDAILVLLLGVLAFRTFAQPAPEEGDTRSLLEFGGLVTALSILCLVPAQHR